MDINLMALNAGNSRLAIGIFEGGELRHATRIPHDQRAEWPARLAEAWAKISDREGAAVAGASVNPTILEPLEHTVEQVTGKKVEWVGKSLELPIKVLTDHPRETGVDRVLNVAAAFEQMEHACVVVDAGTAITVDCCDEQGNFIGGAIAPGVNLMLDALHAKIPRLPRVPFEAPQGTIGKSTEQAILHGVYSAVRGLVKELVENYAGDLGAWPEIIATGGDAETLFGGWELVHAVAPDLTLYGIALAYTEHYIKHGA